ncbi:MAG: biliverdin-producing heme oxygenase [Deltaproteobacteria bacterium]|nr:biliverdin-producing heme oxygenase [Deltaproteobacteria bacterium]
MSSPALSSLREATRTLHVDLESRLALGRPDAGRAEYRAYAAAMIGWLEPLEARLWAAPWPDGVAPEARRDKARWLVEDLAALGVDAAQVARLPRATALPPLATEAERFGVAYVIEGSQLGGHVLARRLAGALAPHEVRYLRGYGEALGERWRALLGAMAASVTGGGALARAADAAVATFEGLGRWFEAREVLR